MEQRLSVRCLGSQPTGVRRRLSGKIAEPATEIKDRTRLYMPKTGVWIDISTEKRRKDLQTQNFYKNVFMYMAESINAFYIKNYFMRFVILDWYEKSEL